MSLGNKLEFADLTDDKQEQYQYKNKSIKDTILPTLRDIFDTPNKPVAFAELDVEATPLKKVNASECVRKGKITDLQEVTVLFKKAIQRMNVGDVTFRKGPFHLLEKKF